jgi:hypothetical protein
VVKTDLRVERADLDLVLAVLAEMVAVEAAEVVVELVETAELSGYTLNI